MVMGKGRKNILEGWAREEISRRKKEGEELQAVF